MRVILSSVGRKVLRLRYYNPWKDERSEHVLEPHRLRLQDGAAYLSGWSRKRRANRTFNVAFVEHAQVQPQEKFRGGRGRPTPAEVGFGIDVHHPGRATIRVRGPLARWLRRVRWDGDQRDEWILKRTGWSGASTTAHGASSPAGCSR